MVFGETRHHCEFFEGGRGIKAAFDVVLHTVNTAQVFVTVAGIGHTRDYSGI
jgi:hypothetical protein